MRIVGWVDYKKDLTQKCGVIEDMANACYGENSDIYMQKECTLVHKKRAGENDSRIVSMPLKGDIYTIVFSGRLFNAEKLQNELNCMGYNVNGCAQTIIACYAEWGELCVQKLDGNFAFAIWQEQDKKLYMARDKAGVCPLYYYVYNDGIIFSSEIRSLLKNSLVPRLIDSDGLKQLFLLGPAKICGSGIIKGIKEIKPCCYAIFENSVFYEKQYFRFTANEHNENAEDTAEHLKCLIIDAVKKQLQGSETASCMLSGGIDSSVVSYILSQQLKEKGLFLDTYSVDYKDNAKYFEKNRFQPDRDNEYINIMKDFIMCRHTETVLDSLDVAKAILDAASARSLPGMADIDSSLLLFLKEIGKRHKTCFTGECADELLGGYPWYHDEEMLYADTFPWSNSLELRKNILKSGVLKNCEEFVYEQYIGTVKQTDYLPSDSKHSRRIREMFILNYYWFMQTLIDRTERMGAAAGVEAALPFCDAKIAEYAYNIPWEIKAYNGREKGIMRMAFNNILPEKVVWRKKSPYPKSWNPVIFEYYKYKLENIFKGKCVFKEIINKDYLDNICKNEFSSPWYGQLMRLPQILGYIIQVNEFFDNFNLELI